MTARTARSAAALAVAALAAAGAGLAASPASATTSGYSPVETCTNVSGRASWTPGLAKISRTETGVLRGSIDGCSSSLTGAAQPGTGVVVLSLSGTASTTASALTGSITVNWPASSGLNPSNGTVRLSGPVAGIYTVNGSVTSGAYTGAALSTSLVVSGTDGAAGTKLHPILWQDVIGSAPLVLSRNFG